MIWKDTSSLRQLVVRSSLLMLGCLVAAAVGTAASIDVRDFGAVGDGVTINTRAFQAAIDRCAKEGGTVMVPAGKFVTGSLELKSHVDIYLAAGATILGSRDLKDYAEHLPAFRSYNDVFLRHSLFYAEKAEGISLRGEGTIDGQGSAFKVTTTVKPDRYRNRPFVIRFVQCKGVVVQGVTMTNSGMWMQHYLACENVRIEGIRVFNHCNKNNDMMDIDGCRNVVIANCVGDTDDDGIALKSTSPRMTENVTITNCILSSHCNALKCGTESTGGFRNIAIANVVVKPSAAESVLTGKPRGISGITLAVVDGGTMETVTIDNVTMEGPHVPIFIRLGNRARKFVADAATPPIGKIRNIAIHHVIATDAGPIGCSVSGLAAAPVEDIRLSNIRMTFAGGGTAEDAAKEPAELEDAYPEGTAWGNLPAYGLFVRHVRGISVSDWKLNYSSRDVRPALCFADVEDGVIEGVQAGIDTAAAALVSVEHSRRIALRQSMPLSHTSTLLLVRDAASSDIFLSGNIVRDVDHDYRAPAAAGVVSRANLR